VGGALALEVVVLLTHRVGLPEWTPAMTLVLIALGLPVTVATTVVQGGLPWLRMRDHVDPNELVGLTPEQVHVVPEAHLLYDEGVLTWRNAVLLGVMSLALLVTSVVAYLTMWALGIGPVGSLLAQGVIERSEPVLVVDFDNHTDDVGLARALTDALQIDLAQSEVVTLVDRERLRRVMASLGLDPAEAVPSSLARDVATAEGIKAYVEGDVARFGGGYRLSVRIVVPPARSPVSQFRESVATEAELVAAIDQLAERVRAKFGESLRVIRAGVPLVDLYGELPNR
jgi:hypothetical protein